MYNWSTDTTRLQENPEEYQKWKLEQLINFGLGKEKLSKDALLKNLANITIDPKKKQFLKYLLYGKKPTHR